MKETARSAELDALLVEPPAAHSLLRRSETVMWKQETLTVSHRFQLEDLERVAGIEPACAAWKAAVLPLNYTRIYVNGSTSPILRNRITTAWDGSSKTRLLAGFAQ